MKQIYLCLIAVLCTTSASAVEIVVTSEVNEMSFTCDGRELARIGEGKVGKVHVAMKPFSIEWQDAGPVADGKVICGAQLSETAVCEFVIPNRTLPRYQLRCRDVEAVKAGPPGDHNLVGIANLTMTNTFDHGYVRCVSHTDGKSLSIELGNCQEK